MPSSVTVVEQGSAAHYDSVFPKSVEWSYRVKLGVLWCVLYGIGMIGGM
jgi:hypothetical protein